MGKYLKSQKHLSIKITKFNDKESSFPFPKFVKNNLHQIQPFTSQTIKSTGTRTKRTASTQCSSLRSSPPALPAAPFGPHCEPLTGSDSSAPPCRGDTAPRPALPWAVSSLRHVAFHLTTGTPGQESEDHPIPAPGGRSGRSSQVNRW